MSRALQASMRALLDSTASPNGKEKKKSEWEQREVEVEKGEDLCAGGKYVRERIVG